MATAAARYNALVGDREEYLTRARRQAKVTIPSLLAESKTALKGTALYTPYQSVGARGVNNLASKLLLALFPPNASSFKLTIDDLSLKEITGQTNVRAGVDEALAEIERKGQTTLETSPFRSTIFEIIKQLIVIGNSCLYFPNPKETRAFKLDSYVTKRSPSGQVIEAVLLEEIARSALPADVLAFLKMKAAQDAGAALPTEQDAKLPSNLVAGATTVSIYTHIYLENGQMKSYQEADGYQIPGTDGSWPVERSPYLFLRWNKIDGEDYGRGYCEEYYGDLFSLECLAEALISGSIIMSKVVFLTDPAGSTRASDLSEAENGAFVEGRAEDISTLQVEKMQDLSFVRQTMADIEQRLAYAFLMNTAIQRPGERVTAEEIRYMARELEDVLGGVYSVQSQDLQLPVVRILLHNMQEDKSIPKLPDEIQPMIVTGLEALGRGHELGKLDAFLQGAREALGDQVIAQYINISDYLTRRAAALGIATGGLVKTQDEVNAANQQQQMMALAPDMMRGGAQLATKAMETQANGQA